ncbi:Ion-translocating oxidoreductase complex subunit C [Sporomusa acidovorans DSM 3132]|uniref:Ion-translocating oxidoreductase complex subunit C n=1 Tax=Sporomusa acidovorans (strain ATCC 49682 / DSM 3132 / Mol) TaxID=1123286 RepID=A0ABZ3IZY2_SPOA4|nr:electron transport complex subunit RsxC [Sporomusa acidovorans DSM 3132]SDE69245.1 Na+-translocating ferredoxin:NAD+ oxidoreductase RNF, RnfC subunit [Sporomusa acidovorans]
MREEIIAAVKAAGVVGAGGAGFPTHVKINASVDTVIVNGAECEPLLRAHQLIMASESAKLIAGLKTVMAATGARQGVIGLKHKYEDAAAKLQAELKNEQAIELFFLPDIYPAGDEQVLVHEVTGRIVPEGGIPLHVGVVVANVETLINVAEAVAGQPVTDKYVTVTGAVNKPATFKVPIGIAIRELIQMAGGATVPNYAVIDGGPMMGKLTTADQPVTKTTGGVIVLPADHSLVTQKDTPWSVIANRAKAVCCNCRACTDVCPRNLLGHSLEPHRIMQALGRGQYNEADVVTKAFLCSECGACDSFGCTMGLSPRRVNAELKRQFGKAKIKNPHNAKPQSPRENRGYRLIPTKRLLYRLGLGQYDAKAPLSTEPVTAKDVKILLSQHIGAPAKPVVAVGDTVNKGDLIAVIPEGAAVGTNLHASISGQVYAVDGSIAIRAM